MKYSILAAFLLSMGLFFSGCGSMHKGHHSCCEKKESCCAKTHCCKKDCAKCKDASDCKNSKDCGNSECGGGECHMKDEPKADSKTKIETEKK